MSAFHMRSAVLALTSAGAAALMACGSSQAAGAEHAWPGSPSGEQAVETIVRLAAERVLVADMVAAAKWGTRQPIDDSAREETILDKASAQAIKLGIARATVQRIFEDQIVANKDVQRALYAQWQEHPAQQPRHRPDLVTQVRPVLDRVDTQLLTAIRQAQPLLSRSDCNALLERGKEAVAQAMSLDAVHRRGLDKALAHTCPPR